jgi:primosomal replication protein N
MYTWQVLEHGGTMTIAVAERLVKDMIQVQIAGRMNSLLGMSVVHLSNIISAKHSSSKTYDHRPVVVVVLTKEQVTN